MKELYFTKENIYDKSLEIYNNIKNIIKKDSFSFIPQKSALLILDMQNFFLDENSHAYIPSSKPIIKKIKSLIDIYTDKKYPVFFTRHLNTKKDARLMNIWWNDLIKKEDCLSEITPVIKVEGLPVINKTQYDAFYKTKLENKLKQEDVEQLIITGVMTHLCCETTARSAFVRGFKVFFPIDTTATYNQNFHTATFLNLSHGFAIPVISNQLIKELK